MPPPALTWFTPQLDEAILRATSPPLAATEIINVQTVTELTGKCEENVPPDGGGNALIVQIRSKMRRREYGSGALAGVSSEPAAVSQPWLVQRSSPGEISPEQTPTLVSLLSHLDSLVSVPAALGIFFSALVYFSSLLTQQMPANTLSTLAVKETHH